MCLLLPWQFGKCEAEEDFSFFVLVCMSEGITLKERGCVCVCVHACVGQREDRKARLLHSVTDRSDIYDPSSDSNRDARCCNSLGVNTHGFLQD